MHRHAEKTADVLLIDPYAALPDRQTKDADRDRPKVHRHEVKMGDVLLMKQADRHAVHHGH